MKLLVIGLDGATWSILKPLVDEGRLPTLKRLVEGGVWGKLESTIPPVTGPSWLSFATGMNPGKTGVFDFLVHKEGSLTLQPISSSTFRGKAFWDTLSSQGHNVGILNFPMLYPPYEINGFIVSGVGASESGDITFPKDLKGEIDKVAGGYEIAVSYHNKKYNDADLFLKDINRVLDKRIRVLFHLLKKKDWDVFIAVFSCTDWLQHLMWKHLDPSNPSFNSAKSERYRLQFVEVWRKIDKILSNLVALYDDANMMMVSDHGFGSQRGCFYVNSWLERHGFLVRRKRVTVDARMRIRDFFMKKFLLSLLSARSVRRTSLQRILKRFDRKVTVESQIDFEKSIAFALGHTIPFGAIYLNVKGREPYGFVERGKQYEQIKAGICGKLVNLGRELNRKLEVAILEPQKVYNGDKVDLAPDILFTINDWECVVIKSFADYVFTDSPYSSRHTGSHRMHGIFVSYGPDMRKGEAVEGIRIYDIAPTILHMFNSRIADNLDGRVLSEVFLEGSETARRRVKQVAPCEAEKKRISEKIKTLKKARKI